VADLREECVLKGFRDFVLRGNIVELAVAVVMATAFNDLVRAFTNDIINPVLGKIFGKPDFSAFHPGGIGIGSFINALIAFLLVALAVYYFIVVPFNKLDELRRRGQVPVEQIPEDIQLLREIRDALVRTDGR
jgi:large conductance mechanosensitive channel